MADTFSVVVHHTQIVLGINIPLFCYRFPFTQNSCEITPFGSI